jgi:iron complex transport system substrate-binding protein
MLRKRRGSQRTLLAVLAPVVALALAQSRAPDVAARTVTDEAGRRVTVPAGVNRVVSLAPNITDILYALGAGKKIAGVTNFTRLPPGAAPKPSVGEPIEPNLERIAALHPDLVFVARSINRMETVESLDRLGIPVYATDTRTVAGMLATIRHVADLVGAGGAGEQLATRLQARLDAVRARLAGRKPKRVLFVVWEDPLITTGRNTFIADALRCAGAESVVSVAQDWPHLSLEEVVRLQPDALIFPATHTGVAGDITRSLQTRPGWRNLTAVEQGRVLVVSDAINRPAPALVDAIEQLARDLHPAAFAPGAAKPSSSGATHHRTNEVLQ